MKPWRAPIAPRNPVMLELDRLEGRGEPAKKRAKSAQPAPPPKKKSARKPKC